MLASHDAVVTRFAPSPTGLLHLGHAHAALFAWRAAQQNGGRFLLRIEDIDSTRCRADFEAAILEDLHWLGITWETPVTRQSERLPLYQTALNQLRALGVIYPCFCSRREIRAEIARAPQAPHGPEGPLYPGTCRDLSPVERKAQTTAGAEFALRLDIAKASAHAGPLMWQDLRHGKQRTAPELLGDVVLARKDIATSYHLAVTVDDAAQGVTRVTRGEDLLPTTHIHRLLQALLGLPVPVWEHHGLLADKQGKRLAKRHDALSLRALREAGCTPAEVRALAGCPD